MIVRIATEDQFELPEELYEEVNRLDDAVVAAVEAGDEGRFRQQLDALMAFVRERGTRVGDDDLRESQVILPPADISLQEAAQDFTGEGVIPDALMPGSA